ncbi:WD repeat-containing protein-like protein [Patellaria atrata CBS 101060]|uniref:WD repeat-containing protein-like protein n=1 Tax=Patellaria atrata CBS 101060 TaxID=1346257 RepID=A0A9P4VS55_9PEZI|nr:WD repeat-containing protein-like protein [Patellaria atrata CBS 101060]
MAAGDGTPSSQAPIQQRVSDVISCFRPCKSFKPESGSPSITSLDFDDTGELALVARDDDTLQIYNCKEGKHAKELKSQKYGVHLARFSHHAQSIIYASTKVDDGIRYLSSHDNSYIRYFKGHTQPVTCISLSPASDNFLSCSEDGTVKLWALNSQNIQGELKLHSAYLAAYDPSATVIAIASPPTQSVLLYDIRNYDKPPFASFDLAELGEKYSPKSRGRDWTRLEFSNDGKSLLLGTNGPGHFILDAFDGALKHYCVRPSTSNNPTGRKAPGESGPGTVSQGDICISPDGRYVIGGSGTDTLAVWDIQSPSSSDKCLIPQTELPGIGRAAIVGYNPRNNLLLSADKNLLFWLPDMEVL